MYPSKHFQIFTLMLFAAWTTFGPSADVAAQPSYLDATFGSDGLAVVDTMPTDTFTATAIQTDGKIVAVGETHDLLSPPGNALDVSALIARFNSDGTPDVSFAGGGVQVLGPGYRLRDVVIQADGKIVAVGQTDNSMVAIRLLNDGSLDPDFNLGGVALLPRPHTAIAEAVDLQADGSIIVGGWSDPRNAPYFYLPQLTRLTPLGLLDTSFGTGGWARFPDGVSLNTLVDVKSSLDGDILVTPNCLQCFFEALVVRFDVAGQLDTSYGQGNGLARYALPSSRYLTVENSALHVEEDGAVIVLGSYDDDVPEAVGRKDYYLVRFDDQGQVDGTFGQGGYAIHNVPGFQSPPSDLVACGEGLLVLGSMPGTLTGEASPLNTYLAAHQGNGTLDMAFGDGGFLTEDVATGNLPGAVSVVGAGSLAVDVAGRTVAVGEVTSGGESDAWVARLSTHCGNVAPNDIDNDGVPDAEDNCPFIANPDQADGDDDGQGDACEVPQIIIAEEGTGVTTKISTTITGILTGGASWTEGQQGSAYSFAGNGYVEAPDPGIGSELDFVDQLSIGVWVRPDLLGDRQVMVSKDDAYELEILPTSNGATHWGLRLNNQVLYEASITLQEGNWQHLAAIWDGETVRYFHNCNPAGEALFEGPLVSNDNSLGLGARPSPNNAGGPTFHLYGALDGLQIVGRPWSETEMALICINERTDVESPRIELTERLQTLLPGTTSAMVQINAGEEDAECRHDLAPKTSFIQKQGTLTPLPGTPLHQLELQSLVDESVLPVFVDCRDQLGNVSPEIRLLIAVGDISTVDVERDRWTMDEGQGCTVSNAAGGVEGTLGPDCEVSAPSWIPEGISGSALQFAGGSQEVVLDEGATMNGLTIAAWVRAEPNLGSYMALFDQRDSDSDGYDLYIDDTSKAFLRINETTLSGNTVVADGAWHHVAATYDGTQLTLYVDGVLDASLSAPAGTIDVQNVARLGRHFNVSSHSLFGALDEVAIYNWALSNVGIAHLVNGF